MPPIVSDELLLGLETCVKILKRCPIDVQGPILDRLKHKLAQIHQFLAAGTEQDQLRIIERLVSANDELLSYGFELNIKPIIADRVELLGNEYPTLWRDETGRRSHTAMHDAFSADLGPVNQHPSHCLLGILERAAGSRTPVEYRNAPSPSLAPSSPATLLGHTLPDPPRHQYHVPLKSSNFSFPYQANYRMEDHAYIRYDDQQDCYVLGTSRSTAPERIAFEPKHVVGYYDFWDFNGDQVSVGLNSYYVLLTSNTRIDRDDFVERLERDIGRSHFMSHVDLRAISHY